MIRFDLFYLHFNFVRNSFIGFLKLDERERKQTNSELIKSKMNHGTETDQAVKRGTF